MITPANVEARLLELSGQVAEAYEWLRQVDANYGKLKATYEIEFARAYLATADQYGPTGKPLTVADREKTAIVATENLRFDLAAEETKAKAARSRVDELRVLTDIARSVSASVRLSIEAG